MIRTDVLVAGRKLSAYFGGGRGRNRGKRGRRFEVLVEIMESRVLLSHVHHGFLVQKEKHSTRSHPAAVSSPVGMTPSEIRRAYGVDQVMFGAGGGVVGDGSGQTIAIVDAYHAPTMAADLHAFNLQFGLPDSSFTVINQNGGSTPPRIDPARRGDSWAVETALDVEWAHVIAPKANIVLVEANSNSNSDLMAAVNTARRYAGVSVVSMSWGGSEFSTDPTTNASFTTPAGHNGVTFVASSGDSGAFNNGGRTAAVGYPAASPNVVSVGGTRLTVDSSGNYLSESGWGYGTQSANNGGSGGGLSRYESQPSYQNGVVTQSSTARAVPDVAFDADPYSGVAVYDSYDFSGWAQIGGTSLAAPMFGAVLAIANQGRVLAGLTTLDGRSQTLPMLYAAPASDFHDVTTGNNGFAAGPGYDLVTGRGTPIVNRLVADLSGNSGPSPVPPPPTVPPPANDNFADGTVITGTTASGQGNNATATAESGEPLHAGITGGKSVWWTWTAPASGVVTLTTQGSNFDTLLGVYTGNAVNSLTRIAANDDVSRSVTTSGVSFKAVAGTTYHIAVDGYHGASGSVTLNLSEALSPANDSFAKAATLNGSSWTGSNAGASIENGEPFITNNGGGASVWVTWTAPTSRTVTVDTIGSNFDTLLGVYTGNSVSGLTRVASNDDDPRSRFRLTSALSFDAVAGTTYRFVIDGYNGATGSIVLNLS